MNDYQLLDSGNGEKLERFGEIVLIRPCAQAIWRPRLSPKSWKEAYARFSREKGNRWEVFRPIPETWVVTIGGIRFQLKRTEFGHLGLFPEHALFWDHFKPGMRFLNLFAYSGGASIAAAKAGAEAVHVDAAKGMVGWAHENAQLNGVSSIRWIVEDARKYLARALRRKERYDAILLDPPSFGRGKSNEVFKIERDLPPMLKHCRELLSESPAFVILSCHTPGFTPIVLKQLLQEAFTGKFEGNELLLKGPFDIPSGAYARWTP
ncbi:MAG: class I SAM-dependent methyltransferase [Chlamydiales bacterium]|nr:class I SAM-dependent methyltransferase [Chlamydiales bacterium]